MARKLASPGSRKKAFLQVLTSLTPFASFDVVEQSFLREHEKRSAAVTASSQFVDLASSACTLSPSLTWRAGRFGFIHKFVG